MGEPNPSVSVDSRMLVSLYNTLNDAPNVFSEDRVTGVAQIVNHEMPLLTQADTDYARTHFQMGFPSARPVAQDIMLTQVSHRLESMGYTVNSVTSSGYGYHFNLSINGREVRATLYPANEDNDGSASFLTRLESTAEILKSPAGGLVSVVDLESHTRSVSFRLVSGDIVELDNHYLTPTAFQNGLRVSRALNTFGHYGEVTRWSSPNRPVFSGSVYLDADGVYNASYAAEGHGDMPHAPLGRAGDVTDGPVIRGLFMDAVDARIRE